MALQSGAYNGINESPNTETDCSILSAIVRVVLGVILLSSVQIDPTYLLIGQGVSVIAGLGQFDVSLALSTPGNFVALWFMLHISSLLVDPRIAIPAMSTSTACQKPGDDCVAYILPGELDWIKINGTDSKILIDVDNPDDATSVLVENAPGYLLEFSSFQNISVFGEADCRIYGASYGRPLNLCLKNVEDVLLGGDSTNCEFF